MKDWYQSRVMWLNLVTLITACGTYFMGTATINEAGPPAFLALLNIFLRFVTRVPIRLGGGIP